MLRIHFTGEDLARTRIASAPEPMWEIMLSLHRLLEPAPKIVFNPWRRRAISQIQGSGLTEAVRMLEMLAPPRSSYFPDFLTPMTRDQLLDTAIDTFMATPRAELDFQLNRFFSSQPKSRRAPSWAKSLAAGDLETIRHFGKTLTSYYDAVLNPCRAEIFASVEADRVQRTRVLIGEGVASLLSGLGPGVRWKPPILEVDYRIDRDLDLQGRGLLLVPSLFCDRFPVTFADQSISPVLVYPISLADHWSNTTAIDIGTGGALAALLGETRANIIEELSLSGDRTTSELARRSNASAATISYHTRVLREAGLIQTIRTSNLAVHKLTKLGINLLEGKG